MGEKKRKGMKRCGKTDGLSHYRFTGSGVSRTKIPRPALCYLCHVRRGNLNGKRNERGNNNMDVERYGELEMDRKEEMTKLYV